MNWPVYQNSSEQVVQTKLSMNRELRELRPKEVVLFPEMAG